jgi:MFS family permease
VIVAVTRKSYSRPSTTNTKFLIVVTVLIIVVIIDVSLVRIYDVVSKLFIPTHDRELLFTIISLICLGAEFALLQFIRPLQTEQERKTKLYINLIYRITKLNQFALGAAIVYIILQISLGSFYTTYSLIAIISCSYLLAIGVLGVFIARILNLLAFRRNMIVLVLFVIAVGSVTANIIITLIDASLRLAERPSEARVQWGGSMDLSKGKFNALDNLYFGSYLISFITAWIATATLLHYYSHKFGLLKFWLITIIPMILFLAQFVPSYATVLFPSIDLDPFFLAYFVTLIATISKPLAGLMLGIGFWTMARAAEKNSPVRRYLVFAGFGFFLLFSSNQAILMSVAPYPPYGIATITATGMSAYLVVLGLYTSTVSMSQNTELRRNIRRLAKSQSTLFDPMVSAESANEIEVRVIETIKKISVEMEERSGIGKPLGDKEAKEYLEDVLREIKKNDRKSTSGSA